jgi:hypothetical protein
VSQRRSAKPPTPSGAEPNSPSSQPFIEQAVLGLENDDEQLMPMDPARHNHKQKRQQRRHRTHANILPRRVVRIYGHAADTSLAIITNGKVTGDGVGPHGDLLDEFPYLGPPHNDSR